MRAYLPANSEVVILRNGIHQWYTTTKTVDVSNYTVGICPVRDALPVLTATVHGFQIWFLENQIEVELTDEQKNFVRMHKFVAVEYDIPARVSRFPQNYRDENGRSFVHPSQWMWGVGVRTTLSCWLMTDEKYQSIMRRLRGLTRAGCTWRKTRIDANDAANHFMQAVVSLRKEWLAADVSYEECMASAEERFQEAGQSIEAERTYRYTKNRIERDLEKRRSNIETGAAILGIPMSWISKETVPVTAVQQVTPSATVVRNAQRAVSKDETEAHCEMVDAMRAAGLEKEAKAVESGEMDHKYAADICEENNVLCDENGVFSLRDVFAD